MELDLTRLDRQQEAANRWRQAKGIGTLVHPMRFGKTFETVVFIINPHLNVNLTNSVIIIVPSEITSKQWEDNLKSYADDLNRIKCYTASYLAVNPKLTLECSLLIVDELQKFLTTDRQSIIDGTRITHHYRLALTGTYPYNYEWITELYPIVDQLTEEEAINNGWTSPFIEYNILLELPANDKAKYEKFTKPITESLLLFHPLLSMLVREEGKRIFNTELDLLNACYRGFQTLSLTGIKKWVTYDQLCNTIAYMMGWHVNLDISIPVNEELNKIWSPMSIHNRAKTFMDYIKKRNDVLIDNNVKLEMVAEIISKNMIPTIVFNESTVFADRLTEYLTARFNGSFPVACYHSQLDSRTMIDPTTGDYFKFTTGDRKGLPKILGIKAIKTIVLDGFRAGYYKILCTAKALDEGLDVPNIEQVICTGGTTNPLTYQQRVARGKTIDSNNLTKITKIYNLVFDNFVNSSGELIKSRDKTKLILRQKQSGASIKWMQNLNEINNTSTD
jgi:superfamily II DNA or RNA helicase